MCAGKMTKATFVMRLVEEGGVEYEEILAVIVKNNGGFSGL